MDLPASTQGRLRRQGSRDLRLSAERGERGKLKTSRRTSRQSSLLRKEEVVQRSNRDHDRDLNQLQGLHSCQQHQSLTADHQCGVGPSVRNSLEISGL